MRDLAADARFEPMQCRGDAGEKGQQPGKSRGTADVAPAFGAEIIIGDEEQKARKAIDEPIEIGGENGKGEERLLREIMLGIRLDKNPAEREDGENGDEQRRVAPPGRSIDPSLVGAEQKRPARFLRAPSIPQQFVDGGLAARLRIDGFHDDGAIKRRARASRPAAACPAERPGTTTE